MVRKRPLCAILNFRKSNICQARLGTNKGNVGQKGTFLQATHCWAVSERIEAPPAGREPGQVRKQLPPIFNTKHDHFTKTGSGQTQENSTRDALFSGQSRISHGRQHAGAVVRKRNAFWEPFSSQKRCIYQDMLGTNVRKVEKQAVSAGRDALVPRPTSLTARPRFSFTEWALRPTA